MRFRWCGDGDCPDWVLAEMATLSRLSSVKLKLLAAVVVQGLIYPPFNMEKAENLFTDSKVEDSTIVKRCVSCVAWIIRGAARSSCDAVALGSELQQLGLPREHALALRRVYTDHVDAIRAKLLQESLRVNPLSHITFNSLPNVDAIELGLVVNNQENKQRVLLSRSTLESMVQDMKDVLNTMEKLNAADHIL